MLKAVFVELLDLIESKGGRLQVLSSIAEGADTIACEVAIELGLPVHLILPKPKSLFKEDFVASPPEAWERVEAVLAYACSGCNGSTLRISNGSHLGSECYRETNTQILDAADVMVFLSDESDNGLAAGTNAFLEKVSELGLPHVVVSTQSDAVHRHNLHDFGGTKPAGIHPG